MQSKFFEEPIPEYKTKLAHRAKRLRKISYLSPGVPKLVLSGKYLLEFVSVGDMVEVEYTREMIIIKYK